MDRSPLYVCYFGTYQATYSRNQILMAGLRAAGVEVIECHAPLWQGIEDRVQVAGGNWASLSFLRRTLFAYKQLLRKYISLRKQYDVMVLGYPGQLDVLLARLLTWFDHKPLVLDLFMSIYLIAVERNLETKSALSVKLLRLLESWACRLPDLLICDTKAYVEWHHQTHGLPPERFRLIPTGADDRLFKPLAINGPANNCFKVLYYGTYIPNHGVHVIVEAAKLLKEHADIQFELVGEGPTRDEANALVKQYALNNIVFTAWLDKAALLEKIAGADLILGVFGTTPQSMMTIQNKIYEALAMKKPIVTGDSPTVRETFQHREHLFLVERDNPQMLAHALLTLRANLPLRTRLAEAGYYKVTNEFTVAALGRRLRQYLEEVVTH